MALAVVIYYLMGGEKIQGQKSGTLYCVMMGTLLFLIAGLRGESVGNDTDGYIRHFFDAMNMPFREILRNYEEPVFYFLCRIIGIFTNSPQIMLMVVGAITGFSFAHFIRKHSVNYMLSFLMLFPFQFYSFCLSGLRQALALSLVLIAYDFVVERRFVPFLIIIAVAFFSHTSALFALPIYLLPNKKPKPLEVFIILLIVPAIYFSRRLILSVGLQYVYSDYELLSSERVSILTVILYGLLAIWPFFVFKKAKEDNFRVMKCVFLGFIIQLFVALEPNIFRIALYYQLFGLLIVPLLINEVKDVRLQKPLAIWLVIIVCFIMFSSFTFTSAGINPYYFFWDRSFKYY